MFVIPSVPAYRQYLYRSFAISILYMAGIFLAVRLLGNNHAAPTPLALAIVAVPAIAILGFGWSLTRLLIDLEDEFLRMLEIRKIVTATGLTLAITSTWGLLEMFTTVPALQVFYVLPIWCMGLVVGALVNKFGYGTAGCA